MTRVGDAPGARGARDAPAAAGSQPSATGVRPAAAASARASDAAEGRLEEGVFRRLRRIGAEDVDAYGHVNNVAWVRFVVELAEAASRAAGFGAAAYRALGGVWIVRRHEIDYHRPALPGETVIEETWVESMRGAASVRRSRFLRASDGAILVEARTRWAFVDARTHRPRRIPRALLEGFPARGTPEG